MSVIFEQQPDLSLRTLQCRGVVQLHHEEDQRNMETNAQQVIADYLAVGHQTIAERADLQSILDTFDQATPDQKRKAYEMLLALAIGASITGGNEQLVEELTRQH